MIILIGAQGSMGRRYQAILRSLGQDYLGYDLGQEAQAITMAEEVGTGLILASPTDTHEWYLRRLSDLPVPILCEKPVTKDLFYLIHFLDDRRAPFRMMCQYQMLDWPDWNGPTLYDFYYHGTDGIGWDCMQLLGLARGTVELYESSPIWICDLNGRRLSLDEIGWAYVEYVRLWLQDPDQNREQIYSIHEKAAAWKGNRETQ